MVTFCSNRDPFSIQILAQSERALKPPRAFLGIARPGRARFAAHGTLFHDPDGYRWELSVQGGK